MDAERLINLAIAGDTSIKEELNSRAKRTSDHFLICFNEIYRLTPASLIDHTDEKFSEYSKYGSIINKYEKSIDAMSEQEIDYLDKISTKLVPVYKRKIYNKRSTSLAFPSRNVLSLCKHLHIKNANYFDYLGCLEPLGGECAITFSSNTPLFEKYLDPLLHVVGDIRYLNLGISFRSQKTLERTWRLNHLDTFISNEEWYVDKYANKLTNYLNTISSIKRMKIHANCLQVLPTTCSIENLHIHSLTKRRLLKLDKDVKIDKLIITDEVSHIDKETVKCIISLIEDYPNIKILRLSYTECTDYTSYSRDDANINRLNDTMKYYHSKIKRTKYNSYGYYEDDLHD